MGRFASLNAPAAAATSGRSAAVTTVNEVLRIAMAGYVTVPLCKPGPHRHKGVDCTNRGKRPLLSDW